MSIGATAKSTTVFNYCGIGASPWQTDLIELITDTTKDKQGMCAPGSHIPVVDRGSVNLNDYDYIFLSSKDGDLCDLEQTKLLFEKT